MPMDIQIQFDIERNSLGQFKQGYVHPRKNHTSRINICPCGVEFVCVTHPKKRGRPVYQRVKYHSTKCREIYSNLKGGVN